MRTKYKTVFISRNETGRTFELAFEIEPAKHIHVVTNVQVYDVHRDAFLHLSDLNATGCYRCKVESLYDYIKFDIEITPISTGAAVSVIEKVITIIHTQENLQPCKI